MRRFVGPFFNPFRKRTKGHPKIVITGGPSAGKTTVTEVLAKEFRDKIVVVPESATILYKGGIPREEDVRNKVFCQRAIYKLQQELENYYLISHPDKAIICDRGSLDALAYWPKYKNDFFKEMGTTRAKEIARYDWVIHMDTADDNNYVSSHVRTESILEARALNKRIHEAWAKHPRRFVISSRTDFAQKIQFAISLVHDILNGKTRF